MKQPFSVGLVCIVVWLPLLGGCGQAASTAPAVHPPPEVRVSLPIKRDITDYEEFPGRAEAVDSIDIRARVTGYLDKVNFKEGMNVSKGDVLVEVDPRLYIPEERRVEQEGMRSCTEQLD